MWRTLASRGASGRFAARLRAPVGLTQAARVRGVSKAWPSASRGGLNIGTTRGLSSNAKDDDGKDPSAKADEPETDKDAEEAAPAVSLVAEDASAEDVAKIVAEGAAKLEEAAAAATLPVVSRVPSYPNVVAVPINSRPMFPGTMYPMTIHDDKLAAALRELVRRQTPYCGVFYRKTDEVLGGENANPNPEPEPQAAAGTKEAGEWKEGDLPETVKKGEESESRAISEALKEWVDEAEPVANKLSRMLKRGGPGGLAKRPTHLPKRLEYPPSKSEDLYQTGIFAQIHSVEPATDGQGTVFFLLAHRRITIQKATHSTPVLRVDVTHIPEDSRASVKLLPHKEQSVVKAYSLEIMAVIKDILARNPLFKEQIQYFVHHADLGKPWLLADLAAGLTSASGEQLQEVVETFDVTERLRKALALLQRELEVSKVQETITRSVDESMTKKQRQYLLQEQLKTIKRELGMEKDDKDEARIKFTERLKDKTVPANVQEVIDEELLKLSTLEASSQEFNITRNYLDWLTCLPYGVRSEENFDVAAASAILEADHYGLDEVKERILEFIAVGALKGSASSGKILCLVGPPGVGKTSLGKSVARSLNREFFRFAVGGMNDVAEIKGHRRTYVGAMPGKLVQCLKKVKTENPVILIDEIDKIGHGGHQGDPSAALLEVLDPEQNGQFSDNYLDVPVDLSKVLFLCTANDQSQIPGPLADRLDFVRIAGYVWQEKLAIAQAHLKPNIGKKTGTPPEVIDITEEAVTTLVKYYCREAGVRNLGKHLERIYRKVALQVVRGKQSVEEGAAQIQVVVTPDNLHDFVGKPLFPLENMYARTPPGVVMGLAWNSMGGTTLYIEAAVASSTAKPSGEEEGAASNGDGGLFVTGQLGDVMKESAQIAYTVAKRELRQRDPTNDFFARNRVHLHVPEGGTPKDGPSAGVSMTTALLSLAEGRAATADVALTGEISLTGKVLPVGGIKEKVIAARRSHVTRVVLPAANRRDFEELPVFVTEGLNVDYAHTYSDVYRVLLGDQPVSVPVHTPPSHAEEVKEGKVVHNLL